MIDIITASTLTAASSSTATAWATSVVSLTTRVNRTVRCRNGEIQRQCTVVMCACQIGERCRFTSQLPYMLFK